MWKKKKGQWRLFITISRASKLGTFKSAGNSRRAVHAEIHSICIDRPRPGRGYASVSTSDTCQSIAILMNRRHCVEEHCLPIINSEHVQMWDLLIMANTLTNRQEVWFFLGKKCSLVELNTHKEPLVFRDLKFHAILQSSGAGWWWGVCTLRHGIQISMEAILACHPARSTEWLDCHPKSCELWRIRTGPIG